MMVRTRDTCTTKTTDVQDFQRRNNPIGNEYDKLVQRPEIAQI